MTKCKLADKKDIPTGKSVMVKTPKGKEIAIFNIDSQFYALENVCPHQGGPLGEGDIEDSCVTCPWHGWQFDIKTGNCVNMPGEEATKIAIEVDGDSIYLTQEE